MGALVCYMYHGLPYVHMFAEMLLAYDNYRSYIRGF